MKNLSDFIQVLLLSGGAVGFICWLIIALVSWQVFKLLRIGFWLLAKGIGSVTISFGADRFQVISRIGFLMLVAMSLNSLRAPIVDYLQYVEQYYINPTYINTDTSVWTLQVYEDQLKQKVSEREFEVVQQATRKTALAIGCSPLAIYEVCYSECGLDPFAANVDPVTGDTVAYGWIQFTNAGCIGTTVGGLPVTMSKVKSWGRSNPRNIEAMMEASHTYLVGRKGANQLPNAVEVYTAVFAPGMCGQPIETVLYSRTGKNPMNYIKNKGLDGYGVEDGKIIKSLKYTDGKITKQDMSLHLALKKSIFLKSKTHE